MKKAIVAIVLSTLLSVAHAQLSLGPRLGVNGNMASTSYSSVVVDPITAGFYAGVFANYKFAPSFAVQLEFDYSQEGTKYKDKGEKTVYTNSVSYLDIPVLIQYRSKGGFYLETGPQLGLLLSANESGGGSSESIKGYVNSTKFSWDFGLGWLIARRVGIGIRYALSGSNLNNGSAQFGYSVKDNVLSLGLSYSIHLKK